MKRLLALIVTGLPLLLIACGGGGGGDRTGIYVYVANFDSDNISQYGINTDGTLYALTPSSMATSLGPRAIICVTQR